MFVGVLALEDDAIGHDDAGAAARREVLGHIVHEQHLAALGLHRETVMRLDSSLRRHERRIGENYVGMFFPAVETGQRVVLHNLRGGEAVQVQVYQ